MVKLPNRLLAAASFVDRGALIADVGTDHGFLPLYLLKNGTAEYAYLIEKNRGPLKRARENTEKYGMSDRTALILSDGLTGLPEYREKEKLPHGFPDTVIMTGMGGPLILKIIDETPEEIREGVRCWILSPQSLIEDFREGLRERNMEILQEIQESDRGKNYIIMKVRGML